MKQRGRVRISYKDILDKAIYVFGDKDKAFAWYLRPCEAFDGKNPFEYAKDGNHEKVLKMLDCVIFSETKG